MENVTIDFVIGTIKSVISNTNKKLTSKRLKISEIEVTINTVFYSSPGVEAKINLGIFQLGIDAKASEYNSNQVKVVFTPEESELELLGDLENNLSSGIEMIVAAVDEGKKAYPEFVFENGEIEVGFVVTKEGKISLIFKGEKKNEAVHKVKLKVENINSGS